MDDRALMEKARVVLDNCRSFYVLFNAEVAGNASPLCTGYVGENV